MRQAVKKRGKSGGNWKFEKPWICQRCFILTNFGVAMQTGANDEVSVQPQLPVAWRSLPILFGVRQAAEALSSGKRVSVNLNIHVVSRYPVVVRDRSHRLGPVREQVNPESVYRHREQIPVHSSASHRTSRLVLYEQPFFPWM